MLNFSEEAINRSGKYSTSVESWFQDGLKFEYPQKASEARIAAVIFNFNYGHYLLRAVRSVQSQSILEPFHVWVYDDCSTDQSRSIINDLAASSPHNFGSIFATRNFFGNGICPFVRILKLLNYEYLALLDADDYWTDESKLGSQVSIMDSDTDCVLSHHSFIGHHEGTDRNDFMRSRPRVERNWNWRLLSLGDGIGTSTVIVRSSSLKDLPHLDGLVSWDWACWSLISQKGRILSTPKVQSCYVVHGSNLWAGGSPDREARELLKVEEFLTINSAEFARRTWERAARYRLIEIRMSRYIRLDLLKALRRLRSFCLQIFYALAKDGRCAGSSFE